MKVYLDYAATTPLNPRVLTAMLPYLKEKFGNPSSIHPWGQEARAAIDRAREQVARALGCSPGEIYFTGTTTTSDNLALQGVARAAKTGHLIISAVEHHGVLETAQALAKEGFKLTILSVDKYGMVDPKDVAKAIQKETILVSMMMANNEVGTIQPIKAIGQVIKQANGSQIYFHTDAAAVVDYLSLKVAKLGVDLMTFGAHKFGGPKGIGALYIREGVKIQPITFGGHHEKSLWPGTEAVPLIVGLGQAMTLATEEKNEAAGKVARLRDRLIKGILTSVSGSRLTGHPNERLADIASFIIEGVEGEAMLLLLAEEGIGASSGSACTSGVLAPSHVLTAMGVPPKKAHGSLRFSLGKATTQAELDYVLKILPKVVARLRQMAPR